MYLRMVQVKIDRDKIGDVQKLYQDRVLPRLQEVPGCLSARLVRSSLHENEVLSMTLWETQEQAEAYARSELFKELLQEARPFMSDSAEWKIKLSKDLTLAYEPEEEEPVVQAFPVVEQASSEIDDFEETRGMHVRIVSPKVQHGKLQEFTQLYREKILPALRQVKGCRYAYLAEGLNSDDVLSVTIWESREDAENYEESGLFDRLTDQIKHTLSELYQWKMSLARDAGKKLTTSEDLRVNHYDIVTGRRF